MKMEGCLPACDCRKLLPASSPTSWLSCRDTRHAERHRDRQTEKETEYKGQDERWQGTGAIRCGWDAHKATQCECTAASLGHSDATLSIGPSLCARARLCVSLYVNLICLWLGQQEVT
eukprot:COSAG05_NODE_12012_length_487_cov_0.703608_1_plen_117_part_10